MNLTFDVETYTRLAGNTQFLEEQERVWRTILQKLRDAQVRLTCFVTGEFVEKHPELVESMVHDGHEIGSHTMQHNTLRAAGAAAFEKDIHESRRFLEQETGNPVRGFRCPHGQAPRDLARMLDGAGYHYDSSVAATYIPGHFDGLRAPRQTYRASFADIRRSDSSSSLWEVPISVLPGVRVPLGGFFMAFAGPLAMRFPSLVSEQGVAYAHPHDFIELRRYKGILPWSYLKGPQPHWRFLDSLLRRRAGADMRLVNRIEERTKAPPKDVPGRTA